MVCLWRANGSYGKSTLPTTLQKLLYQFEEGMYVLFQEPQAITAERQFGILKTN
jgi:hypothetical protein